MPQHRNSRHKCAEVLTLLTFLCYKCYPAGHAEKNVKNYEWKNQAKAQKNKHFFMTKEICALGTFGFFFCVFLLYAAGTVWTTLADEISKCRLGLGIQFEHFKTNFSWIFSLAFYFYFFTNSSGWLKFEDFFSWFLYGFEF